MMPVRLRRGRLAGLAALAGFLCWLAVPGQAEMLESERLRIDWPASADAVTDWRVAVPGSDEPEEWRSLISIGADGQRISRHLAIELADDTAWQALDDALTADSALRRWQSANGNWRLELSLEPAEGAYRSHLDIELQALSPTASNTLSLQLGPGIGEKPMTGLGIATSLYSYTDPVIWARGAIVDSEAAGDDEPLTLSVGDWAGLHSRYFALLAAPRSGPVPTRVTAGRAAGEPKLPEEYLPWIRLDFPVDALNAGESTRWQLELFSGPKTQTALAGTPGSVNHSAVLFQGLWSWMRGLSLGLMWTLDGLHTLVPNWGLAICLLAVLVRLLLYPLGRWALSSQQRFAEVQAEIGPEIKHIKQTYRGGEQSERILQLYETRGVSPLAGLKPLLIVLIQIPVFVALFHVLGQVFEFRDASFLWIDSLAEPDRLFAFGVDLPFFGAWFNLLPVLMAITTLASIKLSPAPAASKAEKRRQNLFLWLMAIVFFLLFYPFPSGMVLYWIMANVLYIAQFHISQRAGRSSTAAEDE